MTRYADEQAARQRRAVIDALHLRVQPLAEATA